MSQRNKQKQAQKDAKKAAKEKARQNVRSQKSRPKADGRPKLIEITRHLTGPPRRGPGQRLWMTARQIKQQKLERADYHIIKTQAASKSNAAQPTQTDRDQAAGQGAGAEGAGVEGPRGDGGSEGTGGTGGSAAADDRSGDQRA